MIDQTLYCVVGGQGSVAVAFYKQTGEEKWSNLSAGEPGYCPPTLINHAGVDQLLIWHPESLNSLNPETGEVYWSVPMRPAYGMSITAPQKQDDLLYVSAIGNLAVLMQLTDDKPEVEVLWSGGGKTGVRSANVTPHMEPGVLFGVDCETSALTAVSLADGERLWESQQPTVGDDSRARHGTAFITKHEPTGNYVLFNEQGDLITAKLTADGYEETGRQNVLEPTSSAFGRPVIWTTPAFADRCVYVRNDKEVVCVDLPN
ncbi:MAG: PQQ-binding-like beta-propeller repeat protein [Planctomycetota bacterium]